MIISARIASLAGGDCTIFGGAAPAVTLFGAGSPVAVRAVNGLGDRAWRFPTAKGDMYHAEIIVR